MPDQKPLRQPITRRLFDNPGISPFFTGPLRRPTCPKCQREFETRLPMQKICGECGKGRRLSRF